MKASLLDNRGLERICTHGKGVKTYSLFRCIRNVAVTEARIAIGGQTQRRALWSIEAGKRKGLVL